MRRDGVYTSGSAGAIDCNQELCDPVEKAMMIGWEQTMNAATAKSLDECEAKLLGSAVRAKNTVAAGLRERGLQKQAVKAATATAGRVVESAIREAMSEARAFAKDQQRQINRQLLPEVQERMKAAYEAARAAPGGVGVFVRPLVSRSIDLGTGSPFEQTLPPVLPLALSPCHPTARWIEPRLRRTA